MQWKESGKTEYVSWKVNLPETVGRVNMMYWMWKLVWVRTYKSSKLWGRCVSLVIEPLCRLLHKARCHLHSPRYCPLLPPPSLLHLHSHPLHLPPPLLHLPLHPLHHSPTLSSGQTISGNKTWDKVMTCLFTHCFFETLSTCSSSSSPFSSSWSSSLSVSVIMTITSCDSWSGVSLWVSVPSWSIVMDWEAAVSSPSSRFGNSSVCRVNKHHLTHVFYSYLCHVHTNK